MITLPSENFGTANTLSEERKVVTFGYPRGAADPAVKNDETPVVTGEVKSGSQTRRAASDNGAIHWVRRHPIRAV